MTTPSIAALNTGPDTHLLDHIAPLAWHIDAPLIVTEEKNEILAKKYYPHVQTRRIEDLEFHLKELTGFDALIECKYWAPHLKELFKRLHGKNIELIFCPHGQSDKGYRSSLLAPYAQQDGVLLYGELLIEMLKELKVWPEIRRFARIGDFRLAHFFQHQDFYDDIVEREVFSYLPSKRKTLLYAPTWNDADGSSSFFERGPSLIEELPREWNLIVKIHPLLKQREPAHYERILALFEKKQNVLLLEDIPLIHPILKRVDAYLGDASSVGYDFLYFQRPMFFFSKYPGRLEGAGSVIPPGAPVFPWIEEHPIPKRAEQKELYAKTFDRPEKIREKIHQMLLQRSENEDHLQIIQ